ncbi:MAG: hypothetical protein PWQ18_1220 [Clostridia bacterium]|nr:hypothetical protein [Clostridia bacterium]
MAEIVLTKMWMIMIVGMMVLYGVFAVVGLSRKRG